MLKKRLIFVLYYDAGNFYLSRNFRLQKVGDVRWLFEKFNFKSIGRFIDEIVILDVGRTRSGERNSTLAGIKFLDTLAYLMRETFIPLTIGGGIVSISDAVQCFAAGADKILLNTALVNNEQLVNECVERYGAQAVVGAIDVCSSADGFITKIANGQQQALSLEEHLQRAAALGVGEVMINNIDRDGTGMGFDRILVDQCLSLDMPLIICGGAGKPEHFGEMLAQKNVEAVATGNLFNFIGKGFEQVRNYVIAQGYPVRNAAIS